MQWLLNKFGYQKIPANPVTPDEIVVKIEIPVFGGPEKENIDTFRNSHTWDIMKEYLISLLLSNMLQNQLDESFKHGWKSCIGAINNMPVGPNPKPDEEEDGRKAVYTDEL